MPFISSVGTQPDTSRGPSPEVWKEDWLAYLADPGRGIGFEDDFLDLPTGKYVFLAENSGAGSPTFILGGNVNGGAISLTTSTSTATQGRTLKLSNGAASSPDGQGFMQLAAGRLLIFEARLTSITNDPTATPFRTFAGFATGAGALWNSTPILNATDYIGLLANASMTFGLVSKNAATATLASQTLGAAGLLTHATYIKLGVRAFLGSNGRGKLNAYANGVRVIEDYDTNAVPSGIMGLAISAISAGTVAPVLSVDWFRMLQVGV